MAIDYLRVSVTSRCNLHCDFCHREGNRGEGDLPLEQFQQIASAARKCGFNKIKFTGGEPLLHPQIVDMVHFAKRSAIAMSHW